MSCRPGWTPARRSCVVPRPERSLMDFPTFTLTLPSEMRMLSIARSFVEAVCQTWQMERNTLHALVLVTGEAVTNIVRHAHRAQPQAYMEVQFEVRQDQ